MKKLSSVKLVVAALFLFALGFFVRNIHKLIAGNYMLHESDIVRIDSFNLLGRVHYVNDGKATAAYEFKSSNGFSFSIGKPTLGGIVDKQALEDTLLYQGLSFTVYSDSNALRSYLASKTPSHINVLQLEIGNRKYIEISKANKSERDSLFIRIGVGIIAFSISIFFIYKKKLLTGG